MSTLFWLGKINFDVLNLSEPYPVCPQIWFEVPKVLMMLINVMLIIFKLTSRGPKESVSLEHKQALCVNELFKEMNMTFHGSFKTKLLSN